MAANNKTAPTRQSRTLALIVGPAMPAAKTSKMNGLDRKTKLKKVIHMKAAPAKAVPKVSFANFILNLFRYTPPQ